MMSAARRTKLILDLQRMTWIIAGMALSITIVGAYRSLSGTGYLFVTVLSRIFLHFSLCVDISADFFQ